MDFSRPLAYSMLLIPCPVGVGGFEPIIFILQLYFIGAYLFSIDICDGLLMIHYFKKQTNEAFHFQKGFGFNAYLSFVVIAVINY